MKNISRFWAGIEASSNLKTALDNIDAPWKNLASLANSGLFRRICAGAIEPPGLRKNSFRDPGERSASF